MQVGVIVAQLRTLQAGRGRGPREGEEETEEADAGRVMRMQEGVGKRRRGDDSRGRWESISGRDAQHAFVGEGRDEVGVGAC